LYFAIGLHQTYSISTAVSAVDAFACQKFDTFQPTVSRVATTIGTKAANLEKGANDVARSVSQTYNGTTKSVTETVTKTVATFTKQTKDTILSVSAAATSVVDAADATIESFLPNGMAPTAAGMKNAAESQASQVGAKISEAYDDATEVVADRAPTIKAELEPKLEAVAAAAEPYTSPVLIFGAETRKVLAKVRAVRSKAQTRVYERALEQFKNMSVRGEETVSKFKVNAVDLIEYAKSITYDPLAERAQPLVERAHQTATLVSAKATAVREEAEKTASVAYSTGKGKAAACAEKVHGNVVQLTEAFRAMMNRSSPSAEVAITSFDVATSTASLFDASAQQVKIQALLEEYQIHDYLRSELATTEDGKLKLEAETTELAAALYGHLVELNDPFADAMLEFLGRQAADAATAAVAATVAMAALAEDPFAARVMDAADNAVEVVEEAVDEGATAVVTGGEQHESYADAASKAV
jgi:hypothetical protein